MKQILLVDDEPSILSSIVRFLKHSDSELEISTASSGQEALSYLQQRHIDVVVTDMHMPGMQGAELLMEIKKRYPQTARFIHAGPSDLEVAIKTIDVAHQYFLKPCNPRKLIDGIHNALRAEELLRTQNLREIFMRMDFIPSVPGLYLEINEKLEDPNTTIQDIGHLIERDPAMTAKMLRLVNSAFFGAAEQISDPGEAVGYLGLGLVKNLVLSLSLFSQYNGEKAKGFNTEALWEYSFATAQMARMIAQMEKRDRSLYDEAFAGGLLHDIGQLILATNFQKDYEKVLYIEKNEEVDITKAEHSVLCATHADLGGFLMDLWGLPLNVVRSIRYHHSPSEAGDEGFTALTAVHVASMLLGEKRPVANSVNTEGLDMEYLEQLGLHERLPEWVDVMV